MNKFNKRLSFVFGMSALVSNNFISAMMREDYNFNINDCKCYLAQKSKSNGENINRYESEINGLLSQTLNILKLLCPDKDTGLCYFSVYSDINGSLIRRDKSKDEIENDLKQYSVLRKFKQILLQFKKGLLSAYISINVLADEYGRNDSFVFDGKNGKLLDSVSTEDLQGESNLIIEYECSDGVRKYKIHISGYTINLEVSKIDISSEQSKKFFFEHMLHVYQDKKDEKGKNFMTLYKSDESLFSKFKKNPHQYMIEEDEVKVTVEKDDEKDKSEEILNFSFYL